MYELSAAAPAGESDSCVGTGWKPERWGADDDVAKVAPRPKPKPVPNPAAVPDAGAAPGGREGEDEGEYVRGEGVSA